MKHTDLLDGSEDTIVFSTPTVNCFFISSVTETVPNTQPTKQQYGNMQWRRWPDQIILILHMAQEYGL